jgi:hypothetical protein
MHKREGDHSRGAEHKRMKQTIPALIAAVVLAAGCAAKPSIVGTWTTAGSSSSGQLTAASNMTYVFDPTGSVTMRQHMTYGPLAMEDDSAGTYTITGNVVTITTTSRTMGLDPSTQQLVNSRMQALHPGAPPIMTMQPPKSIPVKPSSDSYTWTLKDSNTLDLNTNTANPATGHLIEFTRARTSSPQPAQ